MAFVDTATVTIKAGRGGNGAVSFRHEKFVDRGGPDGGDGGRGGDVIFVARENVNTLANFRHNQELKAEDGENGSKRKRHGKSGSPLYVEVPVGTSIYHGQTEVADFTSDGQEFVVAKGGDGGFGNAHFTSSRRQAPRVAERGEPGESFEAQLELKIIADVGLIGLPNAGKSTLLSVVSNARPEIADYPFTTLAPNLGVADIDNESLLIADIPGLIEGASKGKGLGDDFLRHVERTAVLVHLVDVYGEDIARDWRIVEDELKAYRIDLSSRPRIAAISKIEGFDEELLADQIKKLKSVVPKNTPLIPFSSMSRDGLTELLRAAKEAVVAVRAKERTKHDSEDDVVTVTAPPKEEPWRIEQKSRKHFHIRGKKIEKFARRTDFANEHGVRRLRDIMGKMGITKELERRGAEQNSRISFRGVDEEIRF